MALDFNKGVATGPFMAEDETRKPGITVPYGLKEASSADKAAWLEYASGLGYTSNELRGLVEQVYGPQSDASWRSYTSAANIDEPEYRAAELFGKYATGYNPGQAGYDFWNNRIKQIGFEAAKQEFLNPPQGESAPRFVSMFNDPDYQEAMASSRTINDTSDVTTFGLRGADETFRVTGITVPRGLRNMSRAEKAAWYEQQLNLGFDDAQIKQAYEDAIGPISAGDWREISNTVLERDVFEVNPTLTTTPTVSTTPTTPTATTPTATTPTATTPTATTPTATVAPTTPTATVAPTTPTATTPTATTPTATVAPTTPTATVAPTTPTATVTPTTPTATVAPTTPTATVAPTTPTATVAPTTPTSPTVATGPNYGIAPGIAGAKYIGTRGFERPEYTQYAFAERGLGIPDALANILRQEPGAPMKGTAKDLFDIYATGFQPDEAALNFWNNKIREKGFAAARNEFVNPSDINAPRMEVMRQDPDYAAVLRTVQQKADWYNSQIYKGFTDPQVRDFVERTVGPQNDSEWAALRNVAASRDPAGIANLADRARELVSRDLLSFSRNVAPGEGYVRPTTTNAGVGSLLPTTIIGGGPRPGISPTVTSPVVTAPTTPTVITVPTVTTPTTPGGGVVSPTSPTITPITPGPTTTIPTTGGGVVSPTNTPIIIPFNPVNTDTIIPYTATTGSDLTIGDIINAQTGTGTTIGDIINAQGTTGIGPTFSGNPIVPFTPADTGETIALAEGGIASLAKKVQDKGRGDDTMLVHMTPNEVAGLQSLAMQMGGSGTINPYTGLPEFGWLDKAFKKIIKPVAKIAQFVIPFIPGIGLPMAAALSGIAGGFAGAKGGKTFDFKRALVSGITSYGLGSLARSAAAAGQAASVSGANAGQGLASNIDPGMLEGMSSSQVAANVAAQPITAAPGITPAAVAPKSFISELPTGSGPMDYLKATGQNIQTSAQGAPDLFSRNPGVQQAAMEAGAPKIIGTGTMSPATAATTAYMGTTMGIGMDEAAKQKAEQDAIAASIEDEDRRRREYAYSVLAANPWQFAEGGPIDDNPGYDFAGGGMPPRFLSGGGDGMSDSIPANIEGVQEARLADGEFVIPADVVSHLGNGSSKAGAQRLYSMMDRVREARTGTTRQGPEINPAKYMPV